MKTPSFPIKSVLAQELRKAGFVGSSTTWHKQCQDTVLVVNLQKSQYSQLFYINLGVWVRQLGDVGLPKESQCHIRVRATSLPTEKAKTLERALTLEDESMGAEQREAFISEFVRVEALPFLESLATLEGIRAAMDAQKLRGGMVPVRLRELLARQS